MRTLTTLLFLAACAPDGPTLDIDWAAQGVQLHVLHAEPGHTYEVGLVDVGPDGIVSEDCRHDRVCHYVDGGSALLRYGDHTALAGSESELAWLLWERETGRCWVGGAQTRRWEGLGCGTAGIGGGSGGQATKGSR